MSAHDTTRAPERVSTPAAPARIAVFVPSLEAGGAERVMLQLSAALAEATHVDLVLGRRRGRFASEIAQTVRVIELGSDRVVGALPGLARYLRRERPDVVLTTMNHVNVVVLAAAALARTDTPVVVREASNVTGQLRDAPNLRARLMPALMRLTYPRAAKVVAVSRAAADDLAAHIGLPRDAIDVIYNPIDFDAIGARAAEPSGHRWVDSERCACVVGVGRLSREKEWHVLIEAFARARRGPTERLVIIGEGDDRDRLEELARRLEIQDAVDLPGFESNPYAFMRRARIVALTSRWEGLPNVLIQALALGTPVVATDCPGGSREILEGGKYGPLVEVGDVDGVARALRAALDGEATAPLDAAWRDRFEASRVVGRYAAALRAAGRPRRVMLFINRLSVGGAEAQLARLALGLRRRGWDVEVVSLLSPTHFVERLTEAGVPVHDLGLDAPRRWLAPARLRRLVRAHAPDVVCGFLFHASVAAAAAAASQRPRPRVVASLRDPTLGGESRLAITRGLSRLRAVDHFVSNSTLTAERYRARDAEARLSMIPNGLDVDRYLAPAGARERTREALGVAGDTFAWLAVGNLLREKDYPTLLAAFAELDPRARLFIAGRGEPDAEMRRRLAPLRDRVVLLGLRRDVPDLLSACDGFVLSSSSEGMPNAVMEALAAARPVVATRVGGVPEIVPAAGGVIVAPCDPGALAAGMREVMAMSDVAARRMAEIGQRHVRAHYSLERMVDRWEEVLRSGRSEGEGAAAVEGAERMSKSAM